MNYEQLQFYSAMGFALFPCRERHSGRLDKHGKPFNDAKSPLTPNGFKDATVDLDQLRAWHQKFPGCAWACATSAERGVIDIDPRHGGDARLAELVERHGALPKTPTVRTGGGGWHYWFRFPPGTRNTESKEYAIGRKADGGLVIVPPSRVLIPEHEGRAYEWEVKPWECEIALCPEWLLNLKPELKPKAKADGPEPNPWVVVADESDLSTHPGADTTKGEKRRPTLCRLVGIHLARGDSERTVQALASAWAKRCTPPLEPDEWEPHVSGLCRKERAKAEARAEGRTPLLISEVEFEDLCDDLANDKTTERQNPEPQTDGKGNEGGGVPSFCRSVVAHASDETDSDEGTVSTPCHWPTLSPDARHGLLGEMLNAVEPQTEADPAAVLLGWLTCFGSCVGRGAWVQAGADLHHPALFIGIVGRTSDAKGVAWGVAKWPFTQADPLWAKACVCHGVGSGQGLIERVRDERQTTKLGKDGIVKEAVIPAAADKRCLLRLDELASCFKVMRGESSTLGETLLTAWGGEPLEIPNRIDNALSSSGYSISALGDTQPATLRTLLEKGLERHNGWLNRFLWCAVRSNRDLPGGGNISVLEPFIPRLREALAFGKEAGAITRNDEAETLWHGVYGTLKRSGDTAPHTDRARPYVVRLSLLYALADRSTEIRPEHLRAALAVWDYCRESARLIFGGGGPSDTAVPDPLWLRALNLIQKQECMSRTDLRDAFGRNLQAGALDEALSGLEGRGLAHRVRVQPGGGGRPAECWRAGPKPGAESGGDDTVPIQSSPESVTASGYDETTKRQNSLTEPGPEGIMSFGRSVVSPVAVNDEPPARGTGGGEGQEGECGVNHPAPDDDTVPDGTLERELAAIHTALP